MNQNMTPHRPPQRPQQRPVGGGQGQQRSPMQRPPQNKQSRYSTAFIAVLITTAVLLVLSIIVLCVVLAVGGFDKKPVAEPDNNDGGAQQVVQQQNNEQTQPATQSVKAKFLGGMLPSKTASGSYLSHSENAANMAEDADVKSAAAVLVDVSAGVSIAEKEADTKVYPASMTKVMTLLVACERVTDPTAKMTVTQQMVDYHRNTGGSGQLAFTAGESITVEDALYLVNYNSDTVACLLLAEHVAGSEAEFVKLMNQKAQSLGLTKTNFVNTTGLHDENHYTTCREMAAIMQCAMNNPAAKAVLTAYNGYTVSIYRGETVARSSVVYAAWYSSRLSDNSWVGGGSDMKFIAGKTGYEDLPTSCFVTVAENTTNGKWYICVTVGRTSDAQAEINNATSTNDARVIYRRYAEGSLQ